MNKTDNAPDWQKLYSLDSDSDGYSNGVEMGDPTGAWSPGGDPPVGDRISDPGSVTDTPCGNGELDPKMDGSIEECDGAELNGATCADVAGDEAATPTCSSTCAVDYSPCEEGNANNTTGTNNSNGSNNTTGSNNSNGSNNTTGTNNSNGSNNTTGTNNDPGSNNANNTTGGTNNSNTGGGGDGGVDDDGVDDADEGCAQAPMGRVPGAPGLGLLGLFGLFAWRRRRAR